jgi:hypothetical protein
VQFTDRSVPKASGQNDQQQPAWNNDNNLRSIFSEQEKTKLLHEQKHQID